MDRFPKNGEMHPERLTEFRSSETTLSGCRRLQETPTQLQKWLDVFHDASKPSDGLVVDSMDLKERSASSSAVPLLLLPGDTRALLERMSNNIEKKHNMIARSMMMWLTEECIDETFIVCTIL
jgi:hypothetical protein